VLQAATGPAPRLWERRRHDGDFLSVRVALADQPAAVEVREAGDGASEHPVAQAVPVTVPLTEVGVLGLAGARAAVLANARFVLAQLAAWHSPRHVGLVLLVAGDGSADWEWARWLPHLRPRGGEDTQLLVGLDDDQVRHRVAELVAELDARAEHGGSSVHCWSQGRSVVVVLDGARELRRVPGVARLLAEGPAVGAAPALPRRSPGHPAGRVRRDHRGRR
jgi:DNA segregation ATPase FtsK/SpoIIIE, S-DNA-T family